MYAYLSINLIKPTNFCAFFIAGMFIDKMTNGYGSLENRMDLDVSEDMLIVPNDNHTIQYFQIIMG